MAANLSGVQREVGTEKQLRKIGFIVPNIVPKTTINSDIRCYDIFFAYHFIFILSPLG